MVKPQSYSSEGHEFKFQQRQVMSLAFDPLYCLRNCIMSYPALWPRPPPKFDLNCAVLCYVTIKLVFFALDNGPVTTHSRYSHFIVNVLLKKNK